MRTEVAAIHTQLCMNYVRFVHTYIGGILIRQCRSKTQKTVPVYID